MDESDATINQASLPVSHHFEGTTHEAILAFDTVSAYDVKYYYCIKQQSLLLAETIDDLQNEYKNFRASKIYLFVRGKCKATVIEFWLLELASKISKLL